MNTRCAIFLVCVLAFPALVPVSAQDAAPTAAAAGNTLTREQYVAALTRDIAAHFSLEGELQVELLRPWSAPARTAAVWNVSVVEFPNAATSSMMLRCRVTADGAIVEDATLVVRAYLWRDAWATKLPLTIGATFDPAELEARRVDMFRERDALPAAIGDRSYIFARGVAAGRLLTWHDVARRPLVKKGGLVDAVATDGSLVVTMKAVAMENGAQGDTVTVRNPESRKDFAALVIDENRVQVRF